MIVWPSTAESGSNTARGITSVALPALNGMNALMGRSGHSPAKAGAAHPTKATSKTTYRLRGMLPFPFDSRDDAAKSLCSFYAVQAVRGVLHGEEHHVAVGRGLAAVHHIGRDIEQRARFRLDFLAAHRGAEGALQDVDPLLVRMRMRLRAGAGRHAHEADDHAVTLDAGAVGGRIVGSAQDRVHLGEVEQIFAGPGARGARSACDRLGHGFLH